MWKYDTKAQIADSDAQAATNRQYVQGHSDTPAERANAIRALAKQGIGSDGYPFTYPRQHKA